MSYNSGNKRIAQNTLFLSIRQVIVLIITFFVTRLVLEALGVVDYGVYNVVCGFVSMFAFLNTSMSNGIQRFYNYEWGRNGKDGANRVYCTSLYIQFLLMLIIVALTESFGLWYLHHKMVIPPDRVIASEYIFQFAIISFVFLIIQAPYSAAVIAHEKLNFYAVVSVLDAVLKLVIAIILAKLNTDRLILYGLLLACISFLNFLLYYAYCKFSFAEIEYHLFFDKKLFYSMLSFSGWNLFGSFAGVMKEQGINLVLNRFFGPIVNAARGVAVQVNGALKAFVSNVTMPVRPQVIQSYAKEDYHRTISLTFTISKVSCYLLYLMALPVVFELDFLLTLWLGKNVPEHTNTFLIIIVAVSFINNLNSAISGVVHASGRMAKYQVVTSIISIMCIPLSYFVLRQGAAPELAFIMVFICAALSQVSAIVITRSILPFSYKEYLKHVLLPIFVIIVCTAWVPFVLVQIMKDGFCRCCIVFVTSIFITSIAMYFLGLSKSERVIVSAFIDNIKNRK